MQREAAWRPSRIQMTAALGNSVPDVIASRLRVLFCGINPSAYSAAVGHHFARPGNRFWRVLQTSGFTDELLSPFDDRRLLEFGIGITNFVERSTAKASELGKEELRVGAQRLEQTVERYEPRTLAVLGVMHFRPTRRSVYSPSFFMAPHCSSFPTRAGLRPAISFLTSWPRSPPSEGHRGGAITNDHRVIQ
jgi:TDG/mug DNA glycosylase family protein